MLDPLIAIGLVANVLQFVQFTGSLLQQTWALYKGRPPPTFDLEIATRDLNRINTNFKSSSSIKGQRDLSEDDRSLQELCSRCEQLSVELLSLLQGLQVSSPGRKWESFSKAIQAQRKQSKLEDIKNSLDIVREQMNTHLLMRLG
jgi:hypothetical protein